MNATTAATTESHDRQVPDPRTPGVNWPAERLFWARLPAEGWNRAGTAPPGVLGELADEFPIALEELFAVCCLDDQGHLVVCAARVTDLQQLDPATPSLTPSALPGALDDILTTKLDPARFELLVGPFEPRPHRRRRLHHHAVLMGMVLTITALAVIGAQRRIEAWRTLKHEADRTLGSATTSGPPSSAPAKPKTTPAPPPLTSAEQLAQLRAMLAAISRAGHTMNSAGTDVARTDAAGTLGQLCKEWPTELSAALPQSMLIGPDSASIALSVQGDPRSFLTRWHPPQGWSLEEPRLASSGDLTRITLTLRPHPHPQPHTPPRTREGSP